MFIEKLIQFYEKLMVDSSLQISVGIGVLVFAVLYYCIIKFLINNNSGRLIPIIALIMIIFGGLVLFSDNVDNTIYLVVPLIIVLGVVIIYSTELKRLIWQHNNNRLTDVVRSDSGFVDEGIVQNCIDEIIKALQDMSKNDTGALIILSNNNISSQILDSGVKIESTISSELIESIFFPKTPLHDGAMIISGTQIVSAGCFLPLSQKSYSIPKELGTRHRAGIGITETIDVISLIVSEESGIISIAKAGKITRYADINMLRDTLKKYYWQEITSARR